jgi:hypothetical protein
LHFLKHITIDIDVDSTNTTDKNTKRKHESDYKIINDATSVQYYINKFDTRPIRADTTMAADHIEYPMIPSQNTR